MIARPDFLQLDAGAAEPLYRQIYTRFRGAIAEGLLRPAPAFPPHARWRWNWDWRAARWNRPTRC
jgi:hypothetical protein